MLVLRAGLKSSYGSLFLIGVSSARDINTHNNTPTTNLSSRLICLYSGGSVFVVCVARARPEHSPSLDTNFLSNATGNKCYG